MEILFAFLGGLILTSVVAFFIARSVVKIEQKRFDETMAKLSAQVKAETGEMLKARQKEFQRNYAIGHLRDRTVRRILSAYDAILFSYLLNLGRR